MNSSIASKIVMASLGVALMLLTSASDAVAAKRKKARQTAQASQQLSQSNVPARYRDGTLFAPGPVYIGNTYLGYDPDPFIRLMISRDLGKFGGNE